MKTESATMPAQIEAFPGLVRVSLSYKITEHELQVINKFANRETMLFLLLQVHQLDHNLPKVWEQEDIKKFCDKYCDEYGAAYIKWDQFADLIRKLEKKGILETNRQLTFEWI